MSLSESSTPVVLCIMDGVGLGPKGNGNAVHLAKTDTIDHLLNGQSPVGGHCLVLDGGLAAHGLAVGLPSDDDMGNSEVGHNAMGAGRVVRQGAGLVDDGISSGAIFDGDLWSDLCSGETLHFIGLLSDGNVHSHEDHLHALIERAASDGVAKVRVHALTDGRDVSGRSALTYFARLEALFERLRSDNFDCRVASGGGRMLITMDRYDADWEMVRRGWCCHVLGIGERFESPIEAVNKLYERDESVNDQWLPEFVITDDSGEPNGLIESGDSVLFFNFRGDRAIEISRAFEGRGCGFEYPSPPPKLRCFAGMMSYDGDDRVPLRYLVNPPVIDDTLGHRMVASNRRSFVVAETQKFGHVTFFFNGNRSGYIDDSLEQYVEVPSDNVPFETAPAMKAAEVTTVAKEAITKGGWDHVRVNLANGDMVGHTGDIQATIQAMEVVDDCVRELLLATAKAKGVFVLTADHGNADEMLQWNSKKGVYKIDSNGDSMVSTAHSRNRVPFVVVDCSSGARSLRVVEDSEKLGLSSIGSTILALCGVQIPEGWSQSLVREFRKED